MKFNLNHNEDEIVDIDSKVMVHVLHQLKDDDYIILIPQKKMKNSVFLQVRKEAINKYHVEIRFEKGKDFHQYAVDLDKIDECEKLFFSYLEEDIPDINNWNDITGYLKSCYYDFTLSLNKENVHPVYKENFEDNFYYSVSDYFSPFGNDEGFDMMNAAEAYLMKEEENMYYIIHLIDKAAFNKQDEVELQLSLQQIISAGFASLKVNGFIMVDMKDILIRALHAINKLHPNVNYEKMIKDISDIEAMDHGE